MSGEIRSDLLGEAHGFAASLELPPGELYRPRQVHGVRVASADGDPELGEADAVVATVPGRAVGVVTADCVPILARSGSGAAAAIHAGWRGLAAGVVDSGIAALARTGRGELRAVVGPCVSSCCYEVDAPVLAALSERFGAELEAFSIETRPGHARLDLGGLALRALARAGVGSLGRVPEGCTICHTPFESFRRDGAQAGRMLHWIRVGTPVSQ